MYAIGIRRNCYERTDKTIAWDNVIRQLEYSTEQERKDAYYNITAIFSRYARPNGNDVKNALAICPRCGQTDSR